MESSWTEVTKLNTGRAMSGGVVNTSFSFWWIILLYTGATESWDGSAWTEVADLAKQNNRGVRLEQELQHLAARWISIQLQQKNGQHAATFTKINLGQVYYNSGSNAFKVTGQSVPAGTWASGTALNHWKR